VVLADCSNGGERGLKKDKIGILSWLVRWACRAGTRDFCTALAALDGQGQKILHRTLFQFLHPHRPASRSGWAEKAKKLDFQAEKSAFRADKVTFSGRKGDF
jgi:hypothetical protein